MKTMTALKERLAGQKPAAAAGMSRLQIRSVLVPIDFSQPSLSAIQTALPLIKRFGAELHLVHVFEPDYPFPSMTAIPLVLPEVEVGKGVRGRLQDAAKHYSVPLRRENIHAIKGRAFQEICRLANNLNIDLIVLSTRGNTGLKRLALGSTAERVVRYSPCPVLVVHESDSKRKLAKGRTTFQKILVPIDFSDSSMKGLAFAKSWASRFQARLVLLHFVALQYYVTSDEYTRYDFPLLIRQTQEAAQEQMRDLVQKTNWGGVKVKASVQIGHAGQQICANAGEYNSDLIAISTHGRTGLEHVLLGSTAEYVVRHALCPVLVVPTGKRILPTRAG